MDAKKATLAPGYPAEAEDRLPSNQKALSSKCADWYVCLALLVACVYFAQLYTSFKPPYLDLRSYALGHERMPFQARELMRYPLLLAGHSPLLVRATAGKTIINRPELLALELTNFVSLALAGWAAVKLFAVFAPKSRLPLLPFALLIVICLFDFYLTVPFSFPYDLPATMFLGWGAYLVLTGRFGWLLPVFALGTWNRETTLFLVLLLLAKASMKTGRFSWRHVSRREVSQVAVLTTLWLIIVLALHARYVANATEAGPRVSGNLHALMHPMLWPNILSASAFLLPWIWLRRDDLPAPLRAGAWLLPIWVLMLLLVGQILELRIYGDISAFVAVCASFLLVSGTRDTSAHSPDEVFAR